MNLFETLVWALGGVGILYVSGIQSFWMLVIFFYGVLYGMSLARKNKPSSKAKEKPSDT